MSTVCEDFMKLSFGDIVVNADIGKFGRTSVESDMETIKAKLASEGSLFTAYEYALWVMLMSDCDGLVYSVSDYSVSKMELTDVLDTDLKLWHSNLDYMWLRNFSGTGKIIKIDITVDSEDGSEYRTLYMPVSYSNIAVNIGVCEETENGRAIIAPFSIPDMNLDNFILPPDKGAFLTVLDFTVSSVYILQRK